MNNKDLQILQHIERYCQQINTIRQSYQLTQAKLEESFLLRNAVCMSLLQIGELTRKFSSNFLGNHAEIPWHEIRATRNAFAHQYEDADMRLVWQTIAKDIPTLTSYCEQILTANQVPIPQPEPLPAMGDNPAVQAMLAFRKEMAGEGEKVGLKTEEDINAFVKEIRNEETPKEE